MGFSTSGVTAIVIIGLFLVGNAVFAGTMNGLEAVNDARGDEAADLLELQRANVTLDSASLVIDTLHIYVNNTGADAFSVSGTTLFVDGEYVEPDTERVRGDATTDIWAPGETLYVVVQRDAYRGTSTVRLKIVTEHGVGITAEVDL